jgi:hypothetical protein
MNTEHWRSVTDRSKPEYGTCKETCPHTTLHTTTVKWTGPGWKSGLLIEKQASLHLNHITAKLTFMNRIFKDLIPNSPPPLQIPAI